MIMINVFQLTQLRPTLNLFLDTQTLTEYYSIMYAYCKIHYDSVM